MKAEVKFSSSLCLKIAKLIRKSNLLMSGVGCFDLTDEETASVLFTCLNSKNYTKMEKELTNKYELWLRLRGM